MHGPIFHILHNSKHSTLDPGFAALQTMLIIADDVIFVAIIEFFAAPLHLAKNLLVYSDVISLSYFIL